MDKDFNFEDSLIRLEKIVAALEADECPLDKAVELFEEGTALCGKCYSVLNDAKIKVQKLEKGEE